MALPLTPPLLPQLARTAKALPTGAGLAYEPKWDGFRCLAWVDGAETELWSRSGKTLTRYFPDVAFPEGRFVLDGEIVRFDDDGEQDFDALGQRIHPAASRIARLADETPVRYVAFDLLAHDDRSLLDAPWERRRAALEALVGPWAGGGIDLSPVTRDPAAAEPWLRTAEGVMAKLIDAPYRPGERVGMAKVKRVRTMDAVVHAWRPGKEPDTVGSLILSLYDEAGALRVIGHTSGLGAKRKRELVAELAPYETGERFHGEPSRWNSQRELEGVVLRPELVVEVTYDHASNGRIRHGAKLVRWRQDKPARECTLDQLG